MTKQKKILTEFKELTVNEDELENKIEKFSLNTEEINSKSKKKTKFTVKT